MHPYTITKWFKGFIDKNNLPALTVHGLRHYVESQIMGSV